MKIKHGFWTLALLTVCSISAYGQATVNTGRLVIPPVLHEIPNACVEGETIKGIISGVQRFLTVTEPGGGIHIEFRTFFRFEGAGFTADDVPTGNTYFGRSRDIETFFSGLGSLGSEFTIVVDTNLISTGSGSNLILRTVSHTTVAATGETTAFVQSVSTICPGS